MTEKKVIRVILSSPGDVNPEREKVASVIERINKSIADEKGYQLELFRWEKDSIPGLHEKGPQAIIDSLMKMDKSDLWIGLLWQRFGTPTMGSLSGTEHEFKAALKYWRRRHRPHIMLYHKTRKHSPDGRKGRKQARRVERFLKKFPLGKGSLAKYASVPDFEKTLFEHLNTYVKNYSEFAKDQKRFRRKKLRQMTTRAILLAVLAYFAYGAVSTDFFDNVSNYVIEYFNTNPR